MAEGFGTFMKSRLSSPLLAAGRKADPPQAGNQRPQCQPTSCRGRLACAMITDMKARRAADTVYRLAYHFVSLPRYRRASLTGSLAARLEELSREVCDEREWFVEALTLQPDHVDL